jgi:hypothetical protein
LRALFAASRPTQRNPTLFPVELTGSRLSTTWTPRKSSKRYTNTQKWSIIYNSFSFLDLLQNPADLLPHFLGKFTHWEG